MIERVFLVERRNRWKGEDWTVHHIKPEVDRGEAEKVLASVRASYGHNGLEYRIGAYKREGSKEKEHN